MKNFMKTEVIQLFYLIIQQMYGSTTHAQTTQANSDPVILETLQFPTSTNSTDRQETTEVPHEFILDGKPVQIISGSLHYFRVPAVYWRDRLRKLKAAGLNAVSTYVEWSFHEPEERRYFFFGDRDVAHFVRLAADEGLYVLLRPGPYICAERDLGGFPYWLLGKYPAMLLRTTNEDFINETEIWMEKLFQQLGPLLLGRGGPIILVQVENEYGSYGNNVEYKLKMRNILYKHVGENALLYTIDGSFDVDFIRGGAIPGTLTTIGFGSDENVTENFQILRQVKPDGPLMNSEYYMGWVTHWGDRESQKRSIEKMVKNLKIMLAKKINVNFYVFCGGTNFEFTAGANYDISTDQYQPHITSYNYDAPLSEAGDPTAKYYAIRDVLAEHNEKVKDIPLPTPSQKGNYGMINMTKILNLLSKDGRRYLSVEYGDGSGWQLPTFEQLRQRSGLVLYETVLNDTAEGILLIEKPRDLVYVYVDNVLQGVISRLKQIYLLQLNTTRGSVLSLLVENQGRVNEGAKLHDHKVLSTSVIGHFGVNIPVANFTREGPGSALTMIQVLADQGILSEVRYNLKILSGKWSVRGYPLQIVDAIIAQDQKCAKHGPVLYDVHFKLPEGQKPLDTFLDTTGWQKGYAWINGHNLGRYWPAAGPQATLYVPGAWLRAAPESNYLQVLELLRAPPSRAMAFIDRPILDRAAGPVIYHFEDDCANP